MRRAWFLAVLAAGSALACAELDEPSRPDGGKVPEADASTTGCDGRAEDAVAEEPNGSCDLAKPAPCSVGFFCQSFLPSCSGVGQCRSSGECSIYQRFRPVCGCDGRIYSTGCEAALAGVTLAPAETCVEPEKQFPCGPEFCDPLLQFCAAIRGSGYRRCTPMPAECFPKTVDSPPDCACWPKTGPFAGVGPCRIVGRTTLGLEVEVPPPVE